MKERIRLRKVSTIILGLLIAVMVAVHLPVEAQAKRKIVASGQDGDLNWSIDTKGKLVVEGEGDYQERVEIYMGNGNYAVYHAQPDWCAYEDSIKTAQIKVRGIHRMNAFFYGLTNLTSVRMDQSDTSNVVDMSNMFADAESLICVDLNCMDTSSVTDMSGMFQGCTSLEYAGIEDWDTGNVQDMRYMFDGCESLRSLDLNSWDTSQVTDMNRMFVATVNLKELKIDQWDVSNVKNMDSMFYSIGLTELDLTSWNTSSVEDMQWMFGRCKNLERLNISTWDTSNVKNMVYMFQACLSLTELDLNEWNTSNVVYMVGMFSDNPSLRSIYISNWDTSNVEDMSYMFTECPELMNIDVSSFDTSKVEWFIGMFDNCTMLEYLDVHAFDTSRAKSTAYMFNNCKKLKYLDVSNFCMPVLVSAIRMFYNCRSLRELDVTNFDMSITEGFGEMFYNCRNLQFLDTSNWKCEKNLDLYSMFKGCRRLMGIGDLHWMNNAREIRYLFDGCSALTVDLLLIDNTIAYDSCLNGAATDEGAVIRVSYGGNCTKKFRDAVVATGSENSHIVKGAKVKELYTTDVALNLEGLRITWLPFEGAEYYEIQREKTTGSNSNFKTIATIGDTSNMAFLDTTVKNRDCYVYRVIAFVQGQPVIYLNSKTVKFLKTPEITGIKNSGKGTMMLEWKKGINFEGYQIQYSTDKSFPSKNTKKIMLENIKKREKEIKKLQKGKRYYVRIRAFEDDSDWYSVGDKYTRIYSAWSKVKSVKIAS